MLWEDILTVSNQQHMDAKQVLREELQKTILTALSHEGYFTSLVFQGGTALRLFYGNPRFSEDIDFVIKQGETPKDIKKSFPKIKQLITDTFPFLEKTILQTQKDTTQLKRYILKTQGTQPSQQSRIHIELASIPSYENQPRILDFPPFHPAIQVETAQEILADKITAVGCRTYLKGRDIWDIYYLITEKNLSIPWDLVKRKIADYSVSIKTYSKRLEEAEENLTTNGISILSFELKRFLPQPLYQQYENQFSEIIQTALKYIKKEV